MNHIDKQIDRFHIPLNSLAYTYPHLTVHVYFNLSVYKKIRKRKASFDTC